MPAPLIIRIIGDATSYLKAADSTIAANMTLSTSTASMSTKMSESFALSAEAEIAATAKAIRAEEAHLVSLKAVQAQALATGASAAQTAELWSIANTRIAASESKLNRLRGTTVSEGAVSRTKGLLGVAGVGFLSAAAGAEIARRSIHNAEELEAAQRSLDAAIAHTGGNVEVLGAQYLATAKRAREFGVDEITATRELARATLITGDAASAQRAYMEALIISKALGKDFNAVLIAASKAQAGQVTALKRVGVILDANASGQEQFNAITRRYGDQAEANTLATEKFGASLSNLETAIGNTVLPALTPLIDVLTVVLNKLDDIPGAVETIVEAFTHLRGLKVVFDGVAGVLRGKVQPLAGTNLQQRESMAVIAGLPVQLVQQFNAAAKDVQSGMEGVLAQEQEIIDSMNKISKPVHRGQTFFRLTPGELIAQANAALTRSMRDDVAAAKNVVARIKRGIENNKYSGQGLLAARQAEAQALGIVWAAEDAAAQARAEAAQKAAAAAQKAKEKIEAQIQDSIDPLRLEVALSRAQALGKPLTALLKKLRAAAYKALASGKLSLEQQKEAWDQIASLNEQLVAGAQAANRELGFRQLHVNAIIKRMHLTAEQAAQLRAALSQVGPNGTVPGSGVGAAGYVIGKDDRPVIIHHVTNLDGKEIERNTTRHQQHRRRRNPHQRRGPHAGA